MDQAIFDGEVRERASIVVPIGSEVALRGANVFEGIRGYVDVQGVLRILEPRAHLRRLMDSARLLAIDHELMPNDLARHMGTLARLAGEPRDCYLRPSIVVIDGRLPTDASYRAVDYVALAPATRRDLSTTATAIVSSYRKVAGEALPARAKSGGSYLQFRLPSRERVAAGADHVIVTNLDGRIAEAEGAAVVVVRNGEVISPPPSEGALPSITWTTIQRIAEAEGIRWAERPIDRSELDTASAVLLVGTLCEVVPLGSIDGRVFDPRSDDVVRALVDGYERVRRGSPPPGVETVTVDGLEELA